MELEQAAHRLPHRRSIPADEGDRAAGSGQRESEGAGKFVLLLSLIFGWALLLATSAGCAGPLGAAVVDRSSSAEVEDREAGATLQDLVATATTFDARPLDTASEAGATRVGPSRPLPPAPDFTFTLFDGKELTLSDLRGSPVVLNFWASWCPPCRAEARDLERVWQAYRERGVVFLGVDIQDTEEDARAFLEEFGVTYPNGQDTTMEIAMSYEITGIPTTVLITSEGKVARRWVGAASERQLAAFVEELLP